MRTTISATEWRIHEELKLHAAAEGWPVTPRLLGRIAKLAARSAGEPQPADPVPRGTGSRKRKRAPAQSRRALRARPANLRQYAEAPPIDLTTTTTAN